MKRFWECGVRLKWAYQTCCSFLELSCIVGNAGDMFDKGDDRVGIQKMESVVSTQHESDSVKSFKAPIIGHHGVDSVVQLGKPFICFHIVPLVLLGRHVNHNDTILTWCNSKNDRLPKEWSQNWTLSSKYLSIQILDMFITTLHLCPIVML